MFVINKTGPDHFHRKDAESLEQGFAVVEKSPVRLEVSFAASQSLR